MRSFYYLTAIIITMIAFQPDALGQKNYPIGNSKDILKTLIENISKNKRTDKKIIISLRVSKDKILKAEVNYQKFSGDSLYVIGSIENYKASDFFLIIARSYIKGNIVIKDINKAYTYYGDAFGDAFVREDDVNDIVCINYGEAPAENSGSLGQSSSLNAPVDVTNLQSFEGANGCILLDFNGHNVSGTPWNGGNPINAEPSGMTPEAILESWEIVSEDFRPFNLNITTSETVFNTYPKNRRMRCIITPTNTAAPGSGGVAYINSFTWNNDTPCWVFTLAAKSAGEASSHEIGHTLNLGHDGRTSPAEDYYLGQGSWATIMGASYYKSVTQWSKGEYSNANNKEDDLAKIASTTNGVGYRADDHKNDQANATTITMDGSGNIVSGNKGIIETTSDVDFFKFTTSGGSIVLNVNPAARHGNLNIITKLYNSAGTLISTHNPSGLPSSINTNLSAGTYYLSIDGTGEGDPLTTGYTEYASIGSYSIAGTIPASINNNQVPVVSITSPSAGMKYTAPASINITANASDIDGTIAKVEFYSGSVKLGEDANAPYTFTWAAVPSGSYSITAKATDNSGGNSTSANVSIQVTGSSLAPVVSLNSPTNGTTFNSPANINITANASDVDGTIAKVEFFNGSAKLGEDISSPYSFSWNNVVAGSYTLTVVATDNMGLKTTSASSVISVVSPEVLYCISKGNSSSYEYINFLGLGAINNTSGNNGGYRDFTSLTTTLSKNSSYSISFAAGFRGSAYREYWYVWIDFNKDGNFVESERIVYGTSSGTSIHSANFTVPATALAGVTRMRVSMKYQAGNTACGNFTYGEVEDYSVVISEGTAGAGLYASMAGFPLSEDNANSDELSVFPSPANSIININNIPTGTVDAGQIVNLQGNPVKLFSTDRSSLSVDIADLPSGIYLIQITSERETKKLKFVKM